MCFNGISWKTCRRNTLFALPLNFCWNPLIVTNGCFSLCAFGVYHLLTMKRVRTSAEVGAIFRKVAKFRFWMYALIKYEWKENNKSWGSCNTIDYSLPKNTWILLSSFWWYSNVITYLLSSLSLNVRELTKKSLRILRTECKGRKTCKFQWMKWDPIQITLCIWVFCCIQKHFSSDPHKIPN